MKRVNNTEGFSLTEVMMAMSIFSIVIASSFAVFLSGQKAWHSSMLFSSTSFDTSMALQKIVYGIGTNSGLRAAESSSVELNTMTNGWTFSYKIPNGTVNTVTYDDQSDEISFCNSSSITNITLIEKDVTAASATKDGSGMQLSVTLSRKKGMFSTENSMQTYVAFRN